MELFIEVFKQIITYGGLALASGVVTSLLTQALKWQFILAPARRWPRIVAGIISAAVSAGAVAALPHFILGTWIDWVIFGGATFLVATQSYNLVHEAIKNARQD